MNFIVKPEGCICVFCFPWSSLSTQVLSKNRERINKFSKQAKILADKLTFFSNARKLVTNYSEGTCIKTKTNLAVFYIGMHRTPTQ